ncbi:MAG TPA: PIG-L family deacetylase [Tepidisphaeraceae bacterium]|nr:PIG-L family deacetylase [Tepidisphaeraceae bacterium]
MLAINVFKSVRRVLCLGAHCDDIEIGAGGTVLMAQELNPKIEFVWAVFSGDANRHAEQRAGFEYFTRSCGSRSLVLESFRDGYFPSQRDLIKQSFERLKTVQPDLILTHTKDDRHQDHRVICELTWNTFRSHAIWEYEVPKWDGDTTDPNLYVPISPENMQSKVDGLLSSFATQKGKHWFDEELFKGKARLRGAESNCKYAEAFVARKLVVS